MSTGGAVADGLSTADIEEIRAGLAAGRKPRVVFTEQAGQIAGQVGQVVQLTDPADEDEWVVVRFGRDELPFSPADLAVAPRGRAGRQKPAKVEPVEPEPAPPPALVDSSASTAAPTRPASTANTEKEMIMQEESGAAAAASGAAGGGESAAKPAKRAAKKAAKPKAPPAMTVQLAYEGGEWTIAAYQGNKTLAKPYVVRPAEALRIVSMVDVPGVHESVTQIVEAERAEAQRRAEALRTELAEVEHRLSELQGTE